MGKNSKNIDIKYNSNYQDISFIFFSQNYHNIFLRKLVKQGKKYTLNLHVTKSIAFISKIINSFAFQFNLRYVKFIYGLYYNFLLLNCKVFVTKNYKVVKKERNYFYTFLLKNQRVSEIFK